LGSTDLSKRSKLEFGAPPLDGIVEEWMDMMPIIDLSEHRQRGVWYKGGSRVWCSGEIGSRLLLPFQPGNHYTLELDFIRDDGASSIAVFLPTSIGMLTLEIDTLDEHLVDLKELEGGDLRKRGGGSHFTIENGRLYHLRIQVTEKQVDTFVNSKPIGAWPLSDRTASIPDRWEAPKERQLAIGAWQAKCTFMNIQIKREN